MPTMASAAVGELISFMDKEWLSTYADSCTAKSKNQENSQADQRI